jgi:hypothetical protein
VPQILYRCADLGFMLGRCGMNEGSGICLLEEGGELAFINVGGEASTGGKGDSWDKGNTWPTWCSIGIFSHTTWVSPKGVPGLEVEGGGEFLVYGHVLSPLMESLGRSLVMV